MKFTTSTIVAIVLLLGALAQMAWLWSLPSAVPTTSIEYRRGMFLFGMLFGAALLVQSIPLLIDDRKRPMLAVPRWAATFMAAMGIFCILIAISIAYRHIA